jgi:hypothetical protein
VSSVVIPSNEGNKKKSHVGYLCARFEYFYVRFAQQPATAVPRLVPDRNRRALSIPLISFSHTTLLALQKPKKPPEKGKKQRKTWTDSLLSQLKPFQDWFQIEIDELY